MANELDQFKQLPPEPKLGDNIEKEKDNADYNKPLEVSLSDQKKSLNNSLYGFKSTEEPPKKENPELQEQQEKKLKIDENPNSPLIEGFVKQRLLTVEEGEKVKAALIQEGDLAKTIGEIDGLAPEKQTQIIRSIKYLDGKDSKKENLEKFNKDFAQEIEGLKTELPKDNEDGKKQPAEGKKGKLEGGKKGEKELVGQNKDLIEKLGGNYFPIGKEGTKENKIDAQNLAFKRTLNQLMEGKNFKRPETFEQMKNIVKNPELDFGTRFQELCKIDTLITNDQSFSSEKQKKSYENGKEATEKANLSLDEKFAQFKQNVQSSINIKNKDYEKLKALLEEGKELKKETEKKKPGEVFEGLPELEQLQDALKEEA